MKISKKIVVILCTVALLCSLTACDGNKTTADTTTADTSSTLTTTGSNVSADDTADTEEGDEEVYSLGGDVTEKMIELSQLNIGNRVRLENVIKKAQSGQDITIAYIGGSITQGSSAGNELCYARLTTNWFQSTFPDITVNYVNAGIGATGSYIGVHRVDSDVIAKAPDLVFVEFAVNDTTENTERNKNSYDSLLRKLWNSESSPAIITIMMTMQDGTSFQDYHAEIAKSYDLPVVSYKNAILHVINDMNYIEWKDISDDNIHPNVAGHKVLSQLITAYLQKAIDEAASVTGDESNFTTSFTEDLYSSAKALSPADITPDEMSGAFEVREDNFGNFNGFWRCVAADGDFKDAKLKFTVEAKKIALFYGEIVGRGAKFDVFVDGEKVTTIDANFPDGWGNYVECVEISSFNETGTHTIEIVPLKAEAAAYINISRIAIS